MEPEIKRDLLKASAKLGVGLALLGGLIALRVMTATSPGIESGIEDLDRLEAEMVAQSAAASLAESEVPDGMRGAHDSGADSVNADSLGSRMSATLRDRLPDSDSDSRSGDKLVSCELDGRVHFMRADDCASRGGRSTLVPDER